MKNICIQSEHWTLNPSDDFPILPIPWLYMKYYFSLFINKGENYTKPKNFKNLNHFKYDFRSRFSTKFMLNIMVLIKNICSKRTYNLSQKISHLITKNKIIFI